MLLKIILNVCHVSRQGLAFRGDGDESDSNFMQTYLLRSEDDPKLLVWLNRKRDRYTSPEIQNSIIKVMGLQILREITFELNLSPFYTIMVDETTDGSDHEQCVVCLHSVAANFEVHALLVVFLGHVSC